MFAVSRRGSILDDDPGLSNKVKDKATTLTLMRQAIIPASIAFFLLCCFIAPARADFRLCNNSSSRVSVALAYTDGETWISEGWWNLKESGCETLVRGPSGRRILLHLCDG